jgi:tetratricopeptide (TPR) repeat protein
MELLYNPDQMPKKEIEETFVAREKLVAELIALVASQPGGAGMRHVVIIAPRGMGKTTVLLMVKFAIEDRGLADSWLVVKFPEESYGINDLADFWLETLNLIAAETGDEPLRQRAEELKSQYSQSEKLQEAALATIKDWRCKHHKRLLLLVENFDQLLAQINDEHDNARLRDVLMNDGTMMLIGGATTYLKEARADDQPLYNFFKIYDLAELKFEQIQELLRSRAQWDDITDFEVKLKVNSSRLRTLEYFTGGNPRLVLMLYRIVSQSDITEVRRALEKLLDEVTPYYKAKVEVLPPQQRKILDHIARVSGETHEGLTPTDIASAVRLSPNQVSSQLKRLSESGYVRSANLRGRSSYYMLSEPLYAIWHQMRFGRNARHRMQWLITFLRLWYASEEMGAESLHLEARFHEYISANHISKARSVLEHHRYLAEAMESTAERSRATESIMSSYLTLGDIENVKELCANSRAKRPYPGLSEQLLNRLLDMGCISEEDVASARDTRKLSSLIKTIVAAQGALDNKKFEAALRYLDKALKDEPAVEPEGSCLWYFRGIALANLGQHVEALASYDRAMEIEPGDDATWHNRGIALGKLGRYEEALESYDQALALTPDWAATWRNRGIVLANLSRYEEALVSFDRALALPPDADIWHNAQALPLDADIWHDRGITCLMLFTKQVEQTEFESAHYYWKKALESGKRSTAQDWPNAVSEILLKVARSGQLAFVRQLIAESDLEEQLFPLARAIDYLQTNDAALIEKLSPEVKEIVEEVVETLRTVAKNATVPRA